MSMVHLLSIFWRFIIGSNPDVYVRHSHHTTHPGPCIDPTIRRAAWVSLVPIESDWHP